MTKARQKGSGIGILAPTPGSHESESGHIATRMLVSVLLHYHSNVHVFTRETAVMEFEDPDVQVHKYSKPFAEAGWFVRLPGQLLYQLKYILGFLRYRRSLDLVLIGGSGMILPMVFARILGIFILYRVGGVISYNEQARSDSPGIVSRLWIRFLRSVQESLYRLSNIVVVISPSLVDFAELGSFQDKICAWNHYYFDLSLFQVTKEFSKRDPVVGQVGIISEIKGSKNFIESIALVEKEGAVKKAIVVGDGPLESTVKDRASTLDIEAEFTGRVDRSAVPQYLNKMKLLVISSISEGMPKIALEAMACGTPVIATDVGGLPDYIENDQNGFLISNNDPQTIANAISTALNSANLGDISLNSRKYIENNFSYESTVRQYGRLLNANCPYQFPNPPDRVENPLDSQ